MQTKSDEFDCRRGTKGLLRGRYKEESPVRVEWRAAYRLAGRGAARVVYHHLALGSGTLLIGTPCRVTRGSRVVH